MTYRSFLLVAALGLGLGACASDPPGDPPPTEHPDAGPGGEGCSAWQTGTLTGYNNGDPGDDPNAGNLMEFTGLTDDFYANVEIAAVDFSDWEGDSYHWIEVDYNGTVGRVGAWDACRNEDCPDGTNCCTENKERYAQPGYLIDVETRTAARLWGVQDAEDTLNDEIQYRICDAFDPDAIANPFGVYR
jgi:hypothetical protein